MVTPNDIRNPKRKSGFNYVNTSEPNGRGKVYYQAHAGRGANGFVWRGTTRLTAIEAAQDYCDYINGLGLNPPATLKTAGHVYDVDETDTDPEYQAALGVIRDRKAQRAGKKCYVYCITEKRPGGGISTVKVGSSTNPKKRVAELQTGNPRPLMILALTEGGEEKERELHRKYRDDNVLQEWFNVSKDLLLEFDLNADGVPFSSKPAA